MLQKALEGFGRLWEALGRFWEALKYFRMLWEVLGGFGSHCENLFARLWMVWKALEALGMLSRALGSFDVNTVCPSLGSWINHDFFPVRAVAQGSRFVVPGLEALPPEAFH